VTTANSKSIPPYEGDPDGIAFAINDYGQVVGASGDCSTLNPVFLKYFFLSALCCGRTAQ
jgi:hypothetical protein